MEKIILAIIFLNIIASLISGRRKKKRALKAAGGGKPVDPRMAARERKRRHRAQHEAAPRQRAAAGRDEGMGAWESEQQSEGISVRTPKGLARRPMGLVREASGLVRNPGEGRRELERQGGRADRTPTSGGSREIGGDEARRIREQAEQRLEGADSRRKKKPSNWFPFRGFSQDTETEGEEEMSTGEVMPEKAPKAPLKRRKEPLRELLGASGDIFQRMSDELGLDLKWQEERPHETQEPGPGRAGKQPPDGGAEAPARVEKNPDEWQRPGTENLQPARPAALVPGMAAVRSSERHRRLLAMLHNPHRLRDLMVLKAVLDPPVARGRRRSIPTQPGF